MGSGVLRYTGAPSSEVELPTGLAGASRRYNILGELWSAARRNPALGCQVFGSDMLLRAGDVGYYADVQVVCDPSDHHQCFTERPCVVVEVLSERTVRTDHGEKLHAHQNIPTLLAYLIVSQQERRVVCYWRGEDPSRWLREDVTTGDVAIPCLGLRLALKSIYADVSVGD